MIGNTFDKVAKILAHVLRHGHAVFLLPDESHAALAGLAVDANDVGLIFPPDILGIDGKIRYRPTAGILLLPPFHPLGDGVLMRAGKSGKYEVPGVRLPIMNVHPGDALIEIHQVRHLTKVKAGIHPQGKHIHGNGHDVRVAGSFPISKERSLNAIRPSQ